MDEDEEHEVGGIAMNRVRIVWCNGMNRSAGGENAMKYKTSYTGWRERWMMVQKASKGETDTTADEATQYSYAELQIDPRNPLACDTISAARPTSPACKCTC